MTSIEWEVLSFSSSHFLPDCFPSLCFSIPRPNAQLINVFFSSFCPSFSYPSSSHLKSDQELRKISGNEVQTTTLDASLDQLCVTDWARLWMSLIKELRNGVMLKKVNPEELCHRTEFELTPYEMLLDDIRCQRYKLKHVEVNGDILQKVKKDAHELIFEFIRSRPPLVPASRRKLAPRPAKQQSLYDKLMHSIRQEHKLRPTPPPSVRASPFLGRITETGNNNQQHFYFFSLHLPLTFSSPPFFLFLLTSLFHPSLFHPSLRTIPSYQKRPT